MKASVLHNIGDLRHQDIPDVEAAEGEVLVHIKACGICGSDIPRVFTKGTYHFPTVPGHEFAGIVEKLGPNIDEKWLGKKVAVFPLLPCRKCSACEAGKYAQCKDYDYFGSRRDGGFAEYIAVPVWNLIEVPDGISYEAAAMCEPAAVAYHAVSRANVLPGENVLVVGSGTIGLIVAMWSKVSGASRVIITDIDDRNLEFAKKLGFRYTVNSMNENILEKAQEMTDGEGVKYAFDCVGVSAAVENCLEVVDEFGVVVTIGNPAGNITLRQNAYWNILRKELSVLGTWNSLYNGRNDDWKKVMKALEQKQLELEPLITHKYPLEQCVEAFDVIKKREDFIVKVMIVNE